MKYILKNISKSFGELTVFRGFNMEVEENKIISILGPSGCGKTTLLNLMSGILKPDSGEIVGFEDKRISYLFQEPRLLKWKTAYENIDFVLKDVMAKEEREKSIEKYLKAMDLWEYRNYYPKEMSGGMKQRVAMARAFAYPSDVLLMDEPFNSLDMELKFGLMRYFIELWEIDRRTVFFVTHDVHGALMLGDEIYILSKKPTVIKEIIYNEMPKKERSLKSKYILSLEERLYQHFSNY